jgi:hypothetical protein
LVKRFYYVRALTDGCTRKVVLVEEGKDVVGADSFFARTVNPAEG